MFYASAVNCNDNRVRVAISTDLSVNLMNFWMTDFVKGLSNIRPNILK